VATDAPLSPEVDGLEQAVAHVRANAARYMGMPAADGCVDVRVTEEGRRLRANLIRIELANGTSRLPLIVKQTSLPSAPEAGDDPTGRPRLIVRQDYEDRHRFEYLGLRAAHEHFTRLGDPRFGAVRVLDHLPASRAFVIEEVADPTLRDRLATVTRFTPRGRRLLDQAFRNAGAWLREFHALPSPDAAAPPLRASVADVRRAVRELADFLARVTGDRAYFAEVHRGAEAAIEAGALTDPLPLGLAHGDFAPRNVFVSRDGRVAVVDMAARRYAPAYEDVAYFCMSLRSGTARLAVRWLAPGRPRTSRYARLFLAGYFGDEVVPDAAIAVFMLLVTLDNWARIAAESPQAGIVLRAATTAAGRSLRRDVSHLVSVLR
jgi:aminoglycoside phosphotransferase (APT) family kinase protein